MTDLIKRDRELNYVLAPTILDCQTKPVCPLSLADGDCMIINIDNMSKACYEIQLLRYMASDSE